MMGVATGFKSLLALRLALGVGEAAACNAGIAARWFPDKERATVSGLFDSASKFGGAIAMPLIVWMIYTFDWRLTFLIIGSVGILWVIAGILSMLKTRKNTNASVLQKCVLFVMAKTTSRRQNCIAHEMV